VSDLPIEFPESHAQLYDQLQRMFGIGGFDESTSREAWYQARIAEIGKLKSLCRARRASIQQVAIAAWYAKQTRQPIYQSVNLFPLIPDASRAYFVASAQAQYAKDQADLTAAVHEALEAGQTEWAEQLMRATPENTRSLIEKWRAGQ
jgi:hypothetical protein